MPERTAEEATEIRQIALQSIAEIDRGLRIAEMQFRGGAFMAAKQTIADTREMLKLHEGTVQEILKWSKDE
jgi:hypothetical protein